MTFLAIDDTDQLNTLIEQTQAVLVYFSHDACGVCQVLKPKIAGLFNEHFSRVTLAYVDVKAYPEVAAQFSVFTVPSLLIFMQGKESIRQARHISVVALQREFSRGYGLLFDSE